MTHIGNGIHELGTLHDHNWKHQTKIIPPL